MSKRHFIAPADIEPSVLCSLNGGKPDWQLLPPEAVRVIEPPGEGSKVHRETYNPRVEFLDALEAGDIVYAPLGGVGDAFLIGAFQRGISVRCVPFLTLSKVELGPVTRIPRSLLGAGDSSSDAESDKPVDTAAARKKSKLAERAQMVAKMIHLAGLPDADKVFREFREVDFHIAYIRVLINQLIAIQDEVRKRLQQRTTHLERDGAYILKPDTPSAAAMELRLTMVNAAEPVKKLLAYEDSLSMEIERQLKQLDVYTQVLAPVRGIGPRLAARIIAPVVDIRRFPGRAGFTKYAGWATLQVSPDDDRRIAAKFVRGESAQFHELMRMGIWLFAEQLVRSSSQFRWWYDRYKQARADQVGNVVYIDKAGKERKLTKTWLERRARRYAASKFLGYLWFGWWELEGKTFRSRRNNQPFRAADLLDPAAYQDVVGE